MKNQRTGCIFYKKEKNEGSYATFDLFSGIEASRNSEVVEKIKSLDLNTMTPIEAMNLLFELKKTVSD